MFINSSLNIIPKVVTIIPKIIDKKNATDAMLLAFLLSFAPKLSEIKFPAPIPIIEPTACVIVNIANTIPTASLAPVPRRDTKKISTIP